MSLISTMVAQAERLPLPDAITSAGVEFLVSRTDRKLSGLASGADASFAAAMMEYPIASHVEEANAQHYELPPEFFELVLGPHRKYSSCFFEDWTAGLGEAEQAALVRTCDNAGLRDGQRILELGCGWGALTLFMAARYPQAQIMAVSNSAAQRATIEALAATRGLQNVRVVTSDMNVFETTEKFDRIVSVEMFEHMSNWRALFGRCRDWLEPDGRLFLHVFTHARASYRFDHADPADWIARYFFTGGIMPSQALARRFEDIFNVEQEWRWSGAHYARTADLWLENFDRNVALIRPIFEATYGKDAALWSRRWRLFFLATRGLFGHADGEVWGVGHYRLEPVRG